tara:strand:- start:5056 stop:5655 length:600 start_codon:yes stop_codon:yes gene_type:complete
MNMGMSDADGSSHEIQSNPYASPKARIRDSIDSNTPRFACRASRLLAAILNVVIGGAMATPVIVLLLVTDFEAGFGSGPRPIIGGREILLLFVAFGPWITWNSYLIHTRSQSVGKMIMRIKVVAKNGGPAGTARQLILRAGLSQIPGAILPYAAFLRSLIIFPIIDNVFIFTKDKRTLHDRIAGTIVVKVPRKPRRGRR